MKKTRKQKLEEIFYANASEAERLAYDLKKSNQKVAVLESLPVDVVEVEKEVVREVPTESKVTGAEIVSKINQLAIEPEYQIDFSHVKNFPWHLVKQMGESVGISSWGGGVKMSVSGTVDDSNVVFVVASEPMVLVINGGVYESTGGAITWTYSEGNLTLSSPVGTGGSIFALQ